MNARSATGTRVVADCRGSTANPQQTYPVEFIGLPTEMNHCCGSTNPLLSKSLKKKERERQRPQGVSEAQDAPQRQYRRADVSFVPAIRNGRNANGEGGSKVTNASLPDRHPRHADIFLLAMSNSPITSAFLSPYRLASNLISQSHQGTTRHGIGVAPANGAAARHFFALTGEQHE